MHDRTAQLQPWFETYAQTVEVELADEAAAAEADLVLLPLFGGAEWAVSSRWDDNNLTAVRMRDVLAAHGHRGTFYLTGGDQPVYYRGPTPDVDPSALARELCAGGCSVGGHTWTHPMLSYCGQNRIFEEVMRVRCDRESECDRCLTTFSFSYCNWRDEVHGEHLHADIADALLRAGYGHVANAKFVEGTSLRLPVSWLLPADGRPIDDAFAALLADPAARERDPNISFSMHAWYDTPEKWRAFEAQLDAFGRRPNWWYCNQTEYAAYRLQYCFATMELERYGTRLVAHLRRPALADLGDPVPLTFELRGVAPERVVWISAADSLVERLDPAAGAARFHLGHRDGQLLPDQIGWIPNDTNRSELSDADTCPDHPGIRGLLSCQDARLWIDLRCDQAPRLEHVRVTYRTPVAWHEGVIVRRLPDLAPGEAHEQRLGLNAARTDYRYHSGNSFFVAQVDFVRGGRAGRIYLSCRLGNSGGDPTYPQGGFLRLGPLPEVAEPLALLGADGWEPQTQDQLELLDVEVVGTSGRWRATEQTCYLLRSTVHSDSAQQAELRSDESLVSAWIDGRPIRGGFELRDGDNELLLLVRQTEGAKPYNAGTFVRLIEPGTGWRLVNLTYRRPGG